MHFSSRSQNMMTSAFRVLPFILLAATAHAGTSDFIVTTNTGKLRGIARSSGGAEFLGIPYAQPPVGDLRWHEPVPVSPWKDVRDASSFGAPCAQPILGDWNRRDAEFSKEDCLFLNVITPVWPPKEHLPVMVWLHGGANFGGTASSALYKDGTLVQHGIILVTVNYRLGIFGFLSHPALTKESAHHSSGNYGLRDQIAALNWVRENIGQFGGNPDNITLFGQSAGAEDTSLLMASPLSKKLFDKAIAQSGSAWMTPLPSLADAERSGEKLASLLKAPADTGALKYLRDLPVQELLNAVRQDPEAPPLIGPIIDGWVIPENPALTFASANESTASLLIGTTAREFGMPASADEVRKTIAAQTDGMTARALDLYGLANGGSGANDPVYGTAGDQWLADMVFRCPIASQVERHNAAHHATYQYELQHAIPGQEQQGAVHSSDLPYVFGYYPKRGNISGNFSDVDFKLADLIETYWTNFAKTGDPNGAGLPQWPAFGGTQSFIRFKQDGKAEISTGGLRPAQCSLYRDLLQERLKH